MLNRKKITFFILSLAFIGNLNVLDAAQINVKTSYGATGNGTTNDAPAIQNAINAAQSGDTIYFPNGTYLLNSTLTLPVQINLLGENMSSTVLKGNHTGHLINAISNSHANGNQSIANFTINGNNIVNDIEFQGRNNIVLHDLNIYNVNTPRGAITIHSINGSESTPPTTYVQNVSIYNATFNSNNNGSIAIWGIDGAEIYNIDSSERNGSYGSGITIYGQGWLKNVKIHDSEFSGYWADIEIWSLYDECEIYNNTFHGWVSLVSGNKGSGNYGLSFHDNIGLVVIRPYKQVCYFFLFSLNLESVN